MSCEPCYQSRNQPKFQWPVVADEFKEYLDLPLPDGETTVNLPFQVTKASDNILHHSLSIYNATDIVTQAVVPFNITRIDAFGLTILLQAPLPSPNYRIRGLISILP